MYPLNKLIILDLGLNINIINKKSLLRRYKNTTLGKYIWVRDSKASVRGYGDVFIKVIISNEKNKLNNLIIKIIGILNITSYLSFVCNIILF